MADEDFSHFEGLEDQSDLTHSKRQVDHLESIPVEGVFAEEAEASQENARFTPAPEESVYRPDMPDWGAYLRWPIEGEAWICPKDVDDARRLLPSPRVFKREDWDGEFYSLRYGDVVLRVRPTMWTKVPDVDLSVGQQVEVLERNGENDPGIFRIREIFYSLEQRRCEYVLGRQELALGKRFVRSDLRPTQVRYHLRTDFYRHEVPKQQGNEDVQFLDVGDILS